MSAPDPSGPRERPDRPERPERPARPEGPDRPASPLPPPGPPRRSGRQLLPYLIVGQVALHAAMAGQRMTTPLQVLDLGYGAGMAGVVLALFAALPVLTSLAVGRMADRHGYQRTLKVGVACAVLGALVALLACAADGALRLVGLCIGASLSGMGANAGWIGTQRTTGGLSDQPTERLRLFSWLGMAPSAANVIGPVLAGLMIDAGGHAAAYAALALLPLVSYAAGRRLPADAAHPAGRMPAAAPVPAAGVGPAEGPPRRRGVRALLAVPGFRRLLFVNWLFSTSWDVHAFAVPLLGHARGFSASTIGLVLGTFTALVTLVRFGVPLIAEHIREVTALTSAMFAAALVFAIYPLAPTAWAMAACSAALGLALGSVQPMVMNTLYQITPADQQGEAVAIRSMAINVSASVMPLAFGAAGAAFGPSLLLWLTAAAVGIGAFGVPGLQRALAHLPGQGRR